MVQNLLPGEGEARGFVQRDLGDGLHTTGELLTFGLSLPSSRDLYGVGLPPDTVGTATALFIKGCISFRAVIHLCEAGLDRSALPISRSLFETCLNLTFLLRRRIKLWQFKDSKANPKTPWPLFGKKLTPGFRTALLNAWNILKDEKAAAAGERTPGLKRLGRRIQKSLASAPRPYVGQIGPDWETRIRGANTCVGLTIADFAASLGEPFRRWHASVYPRESASVHLSDVAAYLEADTMTGAMTPRWFTSAAEVFQALEKAAMIYSCCVESMHDRFQFGEEAAERLKALVRAIKSWNRPA
jgi:hypothetical protein